MPNFFIVNVLNLVVLAGIIVYSIKKIWNSGYIRKIEAKSIMAIIIFDIIALILGIITIIPNIISAAIIVYTCFILYKTSKTIKIRRKMKKN